jgi:hypothetical protein
VAEPDPEEAFQVTRQRREIGLYIVGAVASLAVGIIIIYFLWGVGELDPDRIIEDSKHGRRGGSGAVYGVVIGVGFIAASVFLAWNAVQLLRRRAP